MKWFSPLSSPQQKVNIPECCSFQQFYVPLDAFLYCVSCPVLGPHSQHIRYCIHLFNTLSWNSNVGVRRDLALGFLLACLPVALHSFYTLFASTLISLPLYLQSDVQYTSRTTELIATIVSDLFLSCTLNSVLYLMTPPSILLFKPKIFPGCLPFSIPISGGSASRTSYMGVYLSTLLHVSPHMKSPTSCLNYSKLVLPPFVSCKAARMIT